MKILGSISLALCHYCQNHKENWSLHSGSSVFLYPCWYLFFYPTLSTHSQDHNLDRYPESLPPFPKTSTFLRPLQDQSLSPPSPSYPSSSPTVFISLHTQLGSLARHSAHLHPCSLCYLIPLFICQTYFWLNINSV